MTDNLSLRNQEVEQQLEYINITKQYPGVIALNNVSFTVRGGRVSAMMGENGAGKSTLLKILSGDISTGRNSILHLRINPSEPVSA
jgi:ABC-type sugar transport system ATPase subunit